MTEWAPTCPSAAVAATSAFGAELSNTPSGSVRRESVLPFGREVVADVFWCSGDRVDDFLAAVDERDDVTEVAAAEEVAVQVQETGAVGIQGAGRGPRPCQKRRRGPLEPVDGLLDARGTDRPCRGPRHGSVLLIQPDGEARARGPCRRSGCRTAHARNSRRRLEANGTVRSCARTSGGTRMGSFRGR